MRNIAVARRDVTVESRVSGQGIHNKGGKGHELRAKVINGHFRSNFETIGGRRK